MGIVLKVGAVIAERYQLDESIAAGGVGQVWQATDLVLRRSVAVKLLRPEYADHPETLERFRAEARHAGSLTHPCIAQVYDFGHIAPSGQPFLVMELVDGPSLADVLAVEPVGAAYALDVISKVAAGLAAAHRAGVVHRDVKPGNILLGPEGHVKITDFGIAHAVGSTPVTDPGMVMGTTQYLAPERIAGAPASPSSDLYSLGIVMHECLTAMPPFEGTPAEVMAAHLFLPLPPLPPDVPPEAEELVMRLTAKDPSDRLSSADDVAGIAGRLSADLAAGKTTAPPQREAPFASPAGGLLTTRTGAAAPEAASLDYAAAGPAGPEHAGPVYAGPAYASPVYAGLEPAGPGTAGTQAPVLASAGSYSEDGTERLGLRRRHRRRTDPRGTGRRRSARKRGAVTAGAVVLAGAGLAGWLAVAGATVSPPTTGEAHHAASGGSAGTARHSQVPRSRASTSPARASDPSARRSSARPASSPSPEPGPATSAPGGSGGGEPSPAPSSSGGGGLLPSLPLPSLPIVGGLGL